MCIHGLCNGQSVIVCRCACECRIPLCIGASVCLCSCEIPHALVCLYVCIGEQDRIRSLEAQDKAILAMDDQVLNIFEK